MRRWLSAHQFSKSIQRFFKSLNALIVADVRRTSLRVGSCLSEQACGFLAMRFATWFLRKAGRDDPRNSARPHLAGDSRLRRQYGR
jgi:hypothetical protein